MVGTMLAIAAIAFLCGTPTAISPPVTFESPCECRGTHEKGRWAVKNDPSDAPDFQSGRMTRPDLNHCLPLYSSYSLQTDHSVTSDENLS
jgi:hypothetical protein